MIYRNTQKAILIVGEKESVQPFAVSRDFTEKEIEETPELRAAIQKQYLVPDDGKSTYKPYTNPRAAQWQTINDGSSGELVKHKTNSGHIVEYIVADANGVDNVPTLEEQGAKSEDGVVTAMSTEHSPDRIETGINAATYGKTEYKPVNASDAIERDLLKESAEAEFDDEDILAEKEGDRAPMLDANDEIAKDFAQVLMKNHGGGSDLKDVRTIIQETSSRALEEINEATKSDPDDGEKVASHHTTNRVVEFLQKPFPAKKWDISKENDKDFLEEVSKVTQSENVRSLAKQRLNELG